jgi:hypothetical protein
MRNQNYAGAKDAGSDGVFRLFLLALGLIAAGLAVWPSDDQHQSPPVLFVSTGHNS